MLAFTDKLRTVIKELIIKSSYIRCYKIETGIIFHLIVRVECRIILYTRFLLDFKLNGLIFSDYFESPDI